MAMIGVLYFYYNQWSDYLLYFNLIPMVITFIVSFFFLIEGPNFLYVQRREKDCL